MRELAIDVKKHKKKFLDQKPSINLVPFIDILFTIMIFLVVTSNFSATDVQTDAADDVKGILHDFVVMQEDSVETLKKYL